MNRLTGLLRARGTIVTLLCCSLFLAGCAKGDGAEREKAENGAHSPRQTILVYMVGSDLETQNGAASADLEEIRTSGVDTKEANIVVLTGGSLKWQTDIPATANTTYYLDGQRWETIDRAESANMGDAQTLSRFLTESVESFPAESYALILWDHGGGPIEGYGFDELYAFDHLTLPEMRQALQNSPFGQEKERLTWVALDACLMASIELANVFANFADYMVASQEAVPNQGLNYSFLSEAGAGLCDGKAAAKTIIDTYADYYERLNEQLKNSRKTITMSCLDLSATNAVEEAVDRISTRLDDTIKNGGYSAVAKERSEARSYGRFTLGQDSDLIDLKVLARQTPNAKAESSALLAALGQLVVYQRSNQEGTSGISIFFPFENKEYLSMDTNRQFGWQDIYEQLGFAPQYAAFLYRFSQTQASNPLADWTGSAAPQTQFDAETGRYFLQLTPEQVQNYDGAAFYILQNVSGEEYVHLFMSRDVTLDAQGRLFANYNNQAIYVINEVTGQSIMPLAFESEREGNIVRYELPILLSRLVNEESSAVEYLSGELQAELNLDTNEISIIGVIPDDEDAAQKPRGKQEIRLEDWDAARFTSFGTYLTRGSDNNPLPYENWEHSGISYFYECPTKDRFSLQMLPLTEKEDALNCIITIADTQGNRYSSQLIPVSPKTDEQAEKNESPKATPMVSVSYPFGSEQVQTIFENEDVSLELMSLRLSDYAGFVRITLQVHNKSNREMYLHVGNSVIDGWVMYGSSTFLAFLEPGEAGTTSYDIDITHSQFHSNMQDCEIQLVKEILATFDYDLHGFGTTLIPLRILTNFEPWTYYENTYLADQVDFPLEEQVVYHDHGVSVRLLDAYVISSMEELCLIFEAETDESALAQLDLQYFSFNGVMFSSALVDGITIESIGANQRLRVPLRYSLPDLAYLGVTSIQDIGFSLSLYGADGSWQEQSWHRLTPTTSITANEDTPTTASSQLTGARLLWDRNGVRMYQLAGDAAGTYGRTFYIENNTPFLIKMMDRDTRVNHVANDDVLFYVEPIAPGKGRFVKFSLLQALTSAEGTTQLSDASFRMIAVNITENTLLFATDVIDVVF